MNTLDLINQMLGTDFNTVEEAQTALIKPQFLATIRSGELLFTKLCKGLNAPVHDTKLLTKEVRFYGAIARTFKDDLNHWNFLQHPTKFDLIEDIFSFMDSIQYRVSTAESKRGVDFATKLLNKLLNKQGKLINDYKMYITEYVASDLFNCLIVNNNLKYDDVGNPLVVAVNTYGKPIKTHLSYGNKLGILTSLAFIDHDKKLNFISDNQETYILNVLDTDYKRKLIAKYSSIDIQTLNQQQCVELLRNIKYEYFNIYKRKYNKELIMYDTSNLEYKVYELDNKLLADIYVILKWALKNKDMFVVSRVTTLLTQRNNLLSKL